MNTKDRIWIKTMRFGHRLGCHQMPERSFTIKGYQFPVCARCTGVILGQALEIMLLCCGLDMGFLPAIFLLAIMGLDWGIQFIKLKESTNIRRLISGIAGGAGLTYVYFRVIKFTIELIKNCLN